MRLSSCILQVRRRLGAGELWVWRFPHKPVDKEMETAGRPKFLENPVVPTPCSWTPARPTLPGLYGSLARPHAVSTARALHERLFRGSITRHQHWLSTLRSAAHAAPRKTRFWLPASFARRDWLPVGFLRKVSVMLLTSLSPFPSFLAQRNPPLRKQARSCNDIEFFCQSAILVCTQRTES